MEREQPFEVQDLSLVPSPTTGRSESRLFGLACRATSLGFVGLAGILALKPLDCAKFPGRVHFLELFSVPMQDADRFLMKRAAMTVLCPALLCYVAADKAESNPELKQTVATAMSVSMMGLAAVGLNEYFRGGASPGIWAVIALETHLMLYFGAVASGKL